MTILTTFVAAGSDGGAVFAVTSPDGVDWTPRSSPSSLVGGSTTGACAAFGAGRWVVGALQVNSTDTDTVILTSDDAGVTWTERVTPFDGGQVLDVLYANGLWVAVGDNAASTATIMTSPDAETWTSRSNPLDPGNVANSVAFGNGLWVVGAEFAGGSTAVTSVDGFTWSDSPVPIDTIFGVGYSNGLWIAAGEKHPGFDYAIVTSPDAAEWSVAASPWDGVHFGLASGVAFNGTTWVACGFGGFVLPSKTIATSADGRMWQLQASAFDGGTGSIGRDVVSSGPGGLFVVVGDNGDNTQHIMTSSDGKNWTERSSALGFIRGVGVSPPPPRQATAGIRDVRLYRQADVGR